MFTYRVIFNLGKRLFPDEARGLVAKAFGDNQRELVAALMNYDPATGKSSNGFPFVQFASASNGFALLGFGPHGRMVLQDVVPIVHAALVKAAASNGFGPIIGLDVQEIENSFELRPYGIEYVVPRMIVEKKPVHAQRLADQVEGSKFLCSLFKSSLQRQAAAQGVSLPDDIDIEFMGATGTAAAVFSGSGKKGFFTLKNAKFKVNARMTGIWAVGFMLSKGYGHFNAGYQLSGMGANVLPK